MSEEKKYRLVYEPLPRITGRVSKYDGLLDEFVESGKPSARLNTGGNGPQTKTLAVALRSRAKHRKLPIKVRTIRGKIYLVRVE